MPSSVLIRIHFGSIGPSDMRRGLTEQLQGKILPLPDPWTLRAFLGTGTPVKSPPAYSRCADRYHGS
jgi:hypothetical protein